MNGVYLLVDGRNGKPFYVGVSVNPERRFEQHVKTCRTLMGKLTQLTPTQQRICDIIDVGGEVTLQIVEWCEMQGRRAEGEWMRKLTREGVVLTNVVSSGGGQPYWTEKMNRYQIIERELTPSQRKVLQGIVSGEIKMIASATQPGGMSALNISRKGLLRTTADNYWVATEKGCAVASYIGANSVNLRSSNMNATFDRQYAEIDAELEKLDEQRRTLMDRRREAVEEEWHILEAAAGDPQKGDLVIFPKKFGDAAQGDVALVTDRYTSTDRFDRAYEAVTVKLSRGAVSVPLTAVMRVNHPDASALWNEIDEKRDALTRIIHKATMIFPNRI